MDPHRAAATAADEKPRRQGSGGGGSRSGSKKSSRRKPSSSSSRGSPGSGGDRAQAYGASPHADSAAGGGAATADLLNPHDLGDAVAQGKEYSRPAEAGLSSRTRLGAKVVRRESGRSGGASREEDRVGSERIQREQTRREPPAEGRLVSDGTGGSYPGSVDRGILEK